MKLSKLKKSGLASLRSAFSGRLECRVLRQQVFAAEGNPCPSRLSKHLLGYSSFYRVSSSRQDFVVRASEESPLKPDMPVINETIHLTDTEEKLFGDLLESTRKAGLTTTLRCAGGWVRDKLMGRESLDIDIALDNMLGKDFADTVNQYLESHGQETHSVAVIMSNPDQSKHLETARMKIRGLWVDLVNLRSEEYAHNSRIPTMTFGTPEQDALRRDFTINSLFYNINEGVVEDLTGRGIADMKQGIIRTPLPPRETFLDDPLRVLRAVRFASRFGFSLEHSLVQAASDDKVRDMLGHKVSRERIGTELDGMIHGPDPLTALDLLRSMGLFEAVFEVHPSATEDITSEFARAGSILGKAACNMLMNWKDMFEQRHDLVDLNSKDVKRQTILAALLLPLRCARVPLNKSRTQSMPAHIIKDSLKWKTKDAEMIDLLHSTAPEFVSAYAAMLSSTDESSSSRLKIQLGRSVKRLKSMWPSGVFLACLISSAEASPLGIEEATEEVIPWREKNAASSLPIPLSKSLEEISDLHEHLEMCKSLEATIKAYKIDTCWQWKPLLNGKEVMSILGMTQGGPSLGVAMDACFDYQLVHPDATTEDLKEFLTTHSEDILSQKYIF